MDQTKFKASCPVCGRNLFRGSTHSYMEGNCPKCGSFLQITFHDTGVSAVTGPPAQAAKAESFKTEEICRRDVGLVKLSRGTWQIKVAAYLQPF